MFKHKITNFVVRKVGNLFWGPSFPWWTCQFWVCLENRTRPGPMFNHLPWPWVSQELA